MDGVLYLNEILEKYKERLINLSGSNRALVSKKLPKKRAFDMWKYEKINSGICDDIISFLFSRTEKSLELLPDYTEFYNTNWQNVVFSRK